MRLHQQQKQNFFRTSDRTEVRKNLPAGHKISFAGWVSFLPGKTKASLLQEITMAFRILFDEVKLKQGIYEQENDRESEHNGVGWPKGTWFQKRLRQVREQQRRKLAETDFVYECALGTITIRQSNGGD